MTPVYRAKTSLEVLSFNDDFMNVKETNPVSANGNSTDASAEENQAKLLQSNSVLELVCAKLGYRKTFADSEPDLAATGLGRARGGPWRVGRFAHPAAGRPPLAGTGRGHRRKLGPLPPATANCYSI